MRKWIAGAAAVTAALVVAIAIATTGASASNGSHVRPWGHSSAQRTTSAPRAAAMAGAQKLVFHTSGGQFKALDNDGNGSDSVGDSFLFTERLSAAGHRVGTVYAECLEHFNGNTMCQATLRLFGRGSIAVNGTLNDGHQLLAVTGGTNQFMDAGGQMDVSGDNDSPGVLVVWLRHLA